MSNKITKIREHKVRHGNVYDTEEIEKFIGEDRATLYYSDPPWGSGNLKYWDTINKRQNENVKESQDSSNFDITKFVTTILKESKKYTKGWVVIEYGQRWSDDVIKMAKEQGIFFCGKTYTLYRSGSKWLPVDMLVFNTEREIPLDLKGWSKIRNEQEIISWFIKKVGIKEGSTIMDLCCGMGNTARVAMKHKCKFIGNELNESRLTKTIKSLERGK